MAAAVATSDLDKLTYEIFSILENKFLFGCRDTNPKPKHLTKVNDPPCSHGKVRILSIDGGDGILAAKSLVHLESVIRCKSGEPNARISDFFDVVAGSGTGGVLAALMFTRTKDGGGYRAGAAAPPRFSAEDALKFLLVWNSLQGRLFRSREKSEKKLLKKVFGDDYTLKDTLKSVLVPCYDLSTDAPFVFSRSDAVEADGYNFRMRDVCAATASARKPSEMTSVDGQTRIVAVDGRVAVTNPTAAAITHVVNNKQEFPFCNGVEDLLVLSLGNGRTDYRAANGRNSSTLLFSRMAEDGAANMVDQAVAMAFAQSRSHSYVRIQANEIVNPRSHPRGKTNRVTGLLESAEEELGQKYVESILFRGKKVSESTNLERLETFGGEIVKEGERRKAGELSPVILKQITVPATPRTSSSSTSLTSTSSSA